MSIVIANIRKRWHDMCELRKKKLTTQNADEWYQKDIGDLLRVVESLKLTAIRHQVKLRELEGKDPIDPAVLNQQYERAIDKLITAPVLIKPN